MSKPKGGKFMNEFEVAFETENIDGKELIETHWKWVPCYICQNAFGRIRLTKRYCNQCGHAFCDGEHGRFQTRGSHTTGICIKCFSIK